MKPISQSSTPPAGRFLLPLVLLGGALEPAGLAQGCIAIRGDAFCPTGLSLADPSLHTDAGRWQVSVGYRWLHSFRHFAGDEETRNAQGQTREEAGTEVINDSHFFDLSLSYQVTPRFSAALVLPFVYSDRSSLYEHKGNASGERYHTEAGGLGDLRLTA